MQHLQTVNAAEWGRQLRSRAKTAFGEESDNLLAIVSWNILFMKCVDRADVYDLLVLGEHGVVTQLDNLLQMKNADK
jgi:hypothetical protein